MKVLILGASGMLGHKLYQVLRKDMEVYGTIRGNSKDDPNIIPYVEAINHFKLHHVIDGLAPDAVVNCIGLVKQNHEAKNTHNCFVINAGFPHKIATMCRQRKIRFIHISTDCVFNGLSGNYNEYDTPSPLDLYGYSKLLGEVKGDNVLTIRTSMIGPELRGRYGLLEWLLSNRGGHISGYTESIFSGFPTITLSKLLKKLILEHRELTGLYHIASDPIDKYSLLEMINQEMDLCIDIQKVPGMKCNRSLNGSKFNKETGFSPLDWPAMVKELVHESNDHTRH